MKSSGIKVKIFDTEYNLQGDNPAQVERIANYVDNLMHRINFESPNQSIETIAIVSSLNIVESFFKEKDAKEENIKDYVSYIGDCNREIDELCRVIDQHL